MKRSVVLLGVAIALMVGGCDDGSAVQTERQSTSTALSTSTAPPVSAVTTTSTEPVTSIAASTTVAPTVSTTSSTATEPATPVQGMKPVKQTTTTEPPESGGDYVAVSFQGTVSYKTFEGGFFAIDGDDGNGYDPINLPDEYAVDGLRVQVTALLLHDRASYHMWGSIVEIVEISAL